ncbi:hypothetical protein VE01_01423 [Pseudogymnoascus verrucosus]|uniref:Uncharacterized protein n=1 Tax=Pseudogymnoascus verrucosus TaxID=342668 RepID=A0A1B8GWS8_9PEZI|nr:uncharacterized protein VE01_01423 [Pseudogymnoascus verrucosus]OBU00269.1 hypothetical protein VE01_01423 [Pseudogymnoascus verrucosus]
MTAWAGIISAQLCGYLSNNRIPLAVACRSRGIWRPEYRLANTLIPVSCSPSSPSTSSTAKSSRFIAQKSRLFSEMFFAITSPRYESSQKPSLSLFYCQALTISTGARGLFRVLFPSHEC